MRVFSVEMLVKEEGAAVVQAALGRLKKETAAVAAEMKATTAQVTSTGRAMQQAGQATEVSGTRAAKAAIGFAAVGQSMARTGSLTADAGTRIVEAGSQIAMMFGTGGIVVSALLAGGVAIATLFGKTRAEIAKTKEELDKLVDVGDIQGLQRELDKLVLGTASQRGRDAITAQATELAKLTEQYRYMASKLSSELTPEETRARGRIYELTVAVREKRDAIADLQNRLGLAADAQRYHTQTVTADTVAVNANTAALKAQQRAAEGQRTTPEGRAAARSSEANVRRETARSTLAGVLQSTQIVDVANVQRDVDTAISQIAGTVAPNLGNRLLRLIRLESIRKSLSDGIRDSVRDGLKNGLEAALATGDIRAFTKALAQTLNSTLSQSLTGFIASGFEEMFKNIGKRLLKGLADMMADFAARSIVFGKMMEAIKGFLSFGNGLGAVLAASALLAFANANGGKASMGSRSIAGGSGGMLSGVTGSMMPTQQIIFGGTSATTAAGMTPRSATNVTIIGPNDPTAQRAMQELLAKANSRGRIG